MEFFRTAWTFSMMAWSVLSAATGSRWLLVKNAWRRQLSNDRHLAVLSRGVEAWDAAHDPAFRNLLTGLSQAERGERDLSDLYP